MVVVAAVPSFPDQLDWWGGRCEMGTVNEMRLEKEEMEIWRSCSLLTCLVATERVSRYVIRRHQKYTQQCGYCASSWTPSFPKGSIPEPLRRAMSLPYPWEKPAS